MKCEFCRKKLNPLLLKQAQNEGGRWSFDIECINVKCRKHNWISGDAYIRLRDDFIKPHATPINNKLPSEMNVIFVSIERHGISWVIRGLNQVHKSMFGDQIIFEKKNAEISPLKAARNDLELPIGWNNVYDISPQGLIDKNFEGQKYDRIVLIQRDLPSLLRSELIYWKAQNIPTATIKTLFRKTIALYHKIYDATYNDPRFIRMSLEALNKYTVVKFKKLLDFLNFPTFGRPPIIPIPTERNWEAFSSILREDEVLCGMLKKIESMEIKESVEDIKKDIMGIKE